MKNLFLTLLFNFILTFSFAQNSDFHGLWETPESRYITSIYVGEEGVSSVVNYDTTSGKTISEEIIEEKTNSFTTFLFNPDNNYSVKIKYILKNKNNLILKFSGDLNKKIKYTRYKLDLKNNKLKT
tara:strand:+ start:414 stop:791 length:378 start_codon:yes stop_codon:yes gene_type:complete